MVSAPVKIFQCSVEVPSTLKKQTKKTYIVSIPEDTALHSVVMTVHAEDEDTGPNGEVLYYLNSTSSGAFSIDNRGGDVYLEETLDREQVDTLTITITATDRGSPRMATTMNLTVHVEDANDHDPVFSQSTYSLTVREDIPRGTSLFLVQAHDQDTGPNGRVRYMLTQASPFVNDSTSLSVDYCYIMFLMDSSL
uniref:Cadherin domain-containing protein n=1 Tax=Lates calcarifer TaxID=8187 RepID=A0A4W6DUD5_LATCA